MCLFFDECALECYVKQSFKQLCINWVVFKIFCEGILYFIVMVDEAGFVNF